MDDHNKNGVKIHDLFKRVIFMHFLDVMRSLADEDNIELLKDAATVQEDKKKQLLAQLDALKVVTKTASSLLMLFDSMGAPIKIPSEIAKVSDDLTDVFSFCADLLSKTSEAQDIIDDASDIEEAQKELAKRYARFKDLNQTIKKFAP